MFVIYSLLLKIKTVIMFIDNMLYVRIYRIYVLYGALHVDYIIVQSK